MATENLDKVKNLFSKVTGIHRENNSYREQAHLELLSVLKGIIDNHTERKEMFDWFRNHDASDKMVINFLKQEILKISGSIVENPMTKDDLLKYIDLAIEAENSDSEDNSQAYEDLVECVECFIDAGQFEDIHNILLEIGEKVQLSTGDEEILNISRSDILAEVVFYVISNIYRSDTEDGVEMVKSSTIFIMPIMLKAKNLIIETPNINKLSKVVKSNLLKRGIINNVESVEIGTSLYNVNNIDDLSFESLCNLHNSILFDYDTGPDNDLRNNIQYHNGEASLIFCFLTVLASTPVEDSDAIGERVRVLDSLYASFEDVSLWDDIGEQMNNINTSYKVYPPQDCLDIMSNVDSYKDMTKMRVILSRKEKNFDLVYSNIKNSDSLLLMFIETSTGLLNMSYQIDPKDRVESVLLELASICEENEISFYKYKYDFNEKDLKSFNNKLETEPAVDAFKYISNATPVDSEWKSWLNIGLIEGNKTLH